MDVRKAWFGGFMLSSSQGLTIVVSAIHLLVNPLPDTQCLRMFEVTRRRTEMGAGRISRVQ